MSLLLLTLALFLSLDTLVGMRRGINLGGRGGTGLLGAERGQVSRGLRGEDAVLLAFTLTLTFCSRRWPLSPQVGDFTSVSLLGLVGLELLLELLPLP